MSALKEFFYNDLYKFTMQHFVMRLFPETLARHKFINRGDHTFTKEMAIELKDRINASKYTIPDQGVLRKFAERARYLPRMYFDFLRGFRFDPTEVTVKCSKEGELSIDIEGPWYRTILWEVPIMAAVSEIYFKRIKHLPYGEKIAEVARLRLMDSMEEIRDFIREHRLTVSEFGTRRAFSYNIHDGVVCNGKTAFAGTSNVHLGLIYNLAIHGTLAHELIQAMAAIYGYRMANEMTMKLWSELYQGDLGIMLTDTFTTDVFFESFGKKYAKLFDGIRHDSGDPFEFGEKAIKHYRDNLNIDPMTKTIVFSDGLNIQKAREINEAFRGDINCSFGIGTSLTNNVGADPLNMVIKLVAIKQPGGRWIDTIKLSDDVGKHVGSEKEIEICKGTLNVE